MAIKFTTFRKINKNRFRKIYPINHFPSVDGFLTDKQLVVETKLVEFSSSSSQEVTLDGIYEEIPVVIGSAFSTSTSEISNVNVFIDAIQAVGGKVSFRVNTSDRFTGKVAIQVLEVI